MSTTAETDGRRDVVQALGELTRALAEKGFAARLVDPETRSPLVRVASREAPRLSENVSCGPDENGELWFRYSWGDLLAPVRLVDAAAERVEHILRPQGM